MVAILETVALVLEKTKRIFVNIPTESLPCQIKIDLFS